jgi:hypothetical protein
MTDESYFLSRSLLQVQVSCCALCTVAICLSFSSKTKTIPKSNVRPVIMYSLIQEEDDCSVSFVMDWEKLKLWLGAFVFGPLLSLEANAKEHIK